MYPHERSLVTRMRKAPFTLLEVNSDPKERLRKAMKREKMSWKCWWDGGDPFGPIASTWNVLSWPTIYLIDHKGIIRYHNVRGKELDRVIDILVAEAREKE